MLYPSEYPRKNLLAIAMTAIMAAQASGCATPGFFAIPEVTITEVYDDNLFYASESEDEQSDLITRVSPALEVGYESETLSLSGSYRFDAEAYASESQLNSSNVRQFADLGVEYLPTERLTLTALADYTKTDTPLDLTLIPGGSIPGLLVGRAEAERTMLHSEGNYRFTPLVTGSLAATWTDEELAEIGKSDTSALETWFDQRLSDVNSLSYGYLYRQYRFDQFGINGELEPSLTRGATQESHTPWIGLNHQFNARSRVVARAGPRFNDGSVDPFVLISFQHKRDNGEVRVEYQRDESTLLGEPRKLDLEALYATISHRFGTRLDVQLTPGYARLDQPDSSVDIYNLGLGAVYKVNESVFLTASYDFNFQKVDADIGATTDVSRNVIQLGVRFTYPRREPRESRTTP